MTASVGTAGRGTLARRFGELDRRELVLLGSVVGIGASAHGHLPLLAIAVAFLAAAYVRPERLSSPAWWAVVAAASFAVDASRFLRLDDHTVLGHYWALAIALSLVSDDPDRCLEVNGRLLIGLTMGIAVVAKLAWGQFADGGFFVTSILLDDRLSTVAWLAGVPGGANDAALPLLGAGEAAVPLATGPRVGLLAGLLTAGTFVIEGGLAVTHLLPTWWAWLHRARTALLVAFCLATYVIVPVAAFGGLLLMMGAADTRFGRDERLRFLVGSIVLYAWGLVWVALR